MFYLTSASPLYFLPFFDLHHRFLSAACTCRSFSKAEIQSLFVLSPESVCSETYELLKGTPDAWTDFEPGLVKDDMVLTQLLQDSDSLVTFVHKEEQHKIIKTPAIEELEIEELELFDAEEPSKSLDTSMSEDVEVLDTSRSSEEGDEPDMDFLLSSVFPVEGEQTPAPAPPTKKRRLVHDDALSSPSPFVKKKSGLPSPTVGMPVQLSENPFGEEHPADVAPKKRRRVIQESEDEEEVIGTQSQSQSQTQGSSTGKCKNVRWSLALGCSFPSHNFHFFPYTIKTLSSPFFPGVIEIEDNEGEQYSQATRKKMSLDEEFEDKAFRIVKRCKGKIKKNASRMRF